MAEQRCRNCQWAKPAANAKFIYCNWPVPIWILQTSSNDGFADIEKTFMHESEGEDCPTWRPKTRGL